MYTILWEKGIISNLGEVIRESFLEEVINERSLHRYLGMC